MWLILPGWGLAPDDYASLAKGLGSDANVVDSWRTPTTGDISAVRAALGADDSEIDLIGHSIGGLAAVEWALRYPEQIGRLVLLDPTTPRSPCGSTASATVHFRRNDAVSTTTLSCSRFHGHHRIK